ncbi:hypothetical protein EVAR_28879_1 [Eumeta japonica]|uniref:Endonuclease-reverse transcriptase n=1 Tax=Eumeta variegata TaxID=151549 RepID=A0A4C1X1R5_EUMVA|nr:hypothetical protein EVAR_28879_1 [Eumeta japonica]
MLRIRKIQKICSEDIRRKTRLTDALEQALRLKWKWAGHLSRYTDKRWSLQTTKWVGPAGKRSKGRPLKRWADDIKELVGRLHKLLTSRRRIELRSGRTDGSHVGRGTVGDSAPDPPTSYFYKLRYRFCRFRSQHNDENKRSTPSKENVSSKYYARWRRLAMEKYEQLSVVNIEIKLP